MKNGEQSAYPLRPYKELAHDYGDNFAAYNGIDISGLTKREYFAAMAMQGLLANPDSEQYSLGDGKTTNTGENKAAFCVFIADELLKQLESKQPTPLTHSETKGK